MVVDAVVDAAGTDEDKQTVAMNFDVSILVTEDYVQIL
jgi:hypothetical protein